MWTRRTSLLVTLALFCSTPALGGLFDDIYRGLQLYSTPVGSPRNSGNRFGRIRVVPNQLGQGYRLELDRNFGADSSGRPEVYDLGNFELQLSGSTQATLGFTRRGLLTGSADVFANNLSYALRAKSGLQDFALSGQLNISQQLEVNQLGFYTLRLQIDNTNSSLAGDGSLALGNVDTDFNVGPLNLRGNFFYDGALALLTALGVDTTSLEGVFPMSPSDRIDQAIRDAFQPQVDALTALMEASDSEEAAPPSLALSSDALGLDTLSLSGSDASDPALFNPLSASQPDGARVPEPASLLLLTLLGAVAFRRRA